MPLHSDYKITLLHKTMAYDKKPYLTTSFFFFVTTA